MKQTPLFELHRTLGGRMVEFGGWEMPVQYPAGILAEHRQCREAAALFDTCHMGVFRVSGPAVGAALDRLLPRSVSGQAPGSCRYNFLVNEQGGVLDDLLTYRMDAGTFLLVVNAGTAEGDAAWLRAQLPPEVKFEDLREAWGKLDLQGPRAFDVLADLGVPTATLPAYYHWTPLSLFGLDMLISRTGYTGERGVELYFPREQAPMVWNRLLEQPLVKPAGLGARDTLRLEMGYPLYGHELNETTTPVEAGFGRLLNLRDRECMGAQALRQPPRRRLTGLRLAGRRAARAGMTVVDPVSGQVIGTVTSGAFSPNLGVAVALAYLAGAEPPATGMPVRVTDPASGAVLDATVAPPPFYRQGTATK